MARNGCEWNFIVVMNGWMVDNEYKHYNNLHEM